MKLFKWFLKRKLMCKHDWQPMKIRQVKVEDGRLVGFISETFEILECSKCGKHNVIVPPQFH